MFAIKEHNNLMACGFLGTRYILHSVCNMGKPELAMSMIKGPGHPSYGEMINNGQTTLTEAFLNYENDIQSSQNHHFFGDVISLMIQEFVGLKINPYLTDKNYIEISPLFNCGLNEASASYLSEYGIVEVKWNRNKDNIILNIKKPNGIKANIVLNYGYNIDKNTIIPINSTEETFIITK